MDTVKLSLLLAALASLHFMCEAKQLEFLSLSPEDLHVVYRQSDKEGVALSSEITDEHHQVSIKNLDGEQLVSVTSLNKNSSLLWKILDYNIFFHGTAEQEGEEAEVMELALAPPGRNQRVLVQSLAQQEETNNEIKQAALNELLARRELDTIIDATHALGKAGVVGHENRAALNLYAVAMTLAKFQNHRDSALGRQMQGNEQSRTAARSKREEKKTCSKPPLLKPIWWAIPDKWFRCERCPLPEAEECEGLCGRMCDCWDWACGDCCYHQGCYDHDVCCGEHGMLHAKCMWVLPFDCKGYRHKCEN